MVDAEGEEARQMNTQDRTGTVKQADRQVDCRTQDAEDQARGGEGERGEGERERERKGLLKKS